MGQQSIVLHRPGQPIEAGSAAGVCTDCCVDQLQHMQLAAAAGGAGAGAVVAAAAAAAAAGGGGAAAGAAAAAVDCRLWQSNKRECPPCFPAMVRGTDAARKGLLHLQGLWCS
eukprot:scaffold33462_cov19-Tisochrysis_lutea.AAC.2